MPLTFDHTDWTQLTRAIVPNSANPVFLCCSGADNPQLVVKFAPGVERIRFANTVFERMLLTPSRTRYLQYSDPELTDIFRALDRVLGKNGKLQSAKEARGFGIMVMEITPGRNWDDSLGVSMDNERGIFDAFVQRFGQATIQEDFAKLIAADLLLGNFDRASFLKRQGGAEISKIHGGNFFYQELAGVAHLLPIDNDTIQPSRQHISAAATPEDFYRAVIEGAFLDDPNRVFPEATQSSMDCLLGPDAAQKIAFMFADNFRRGSLGPAKDVNTWLPFATHMVPHVRQALVQILTFRKNHLATEGLNSIMKSYRAVEGMNYDAFKVRCRFAEMMTAAMGGAPNHAETDANKLKAISYGKYRDWKGLYLHCCEPPAPYPIPGFAHAPHLSLKEKAQRKASSLLGRGDATELEQRKQAHTAKSMARQGRVTEAELRQAWDRIKNLPNTDRAVVKSKILLIAEMLRYDLLARTDIFNEIGALARSGDWVAVFYCKFLRKRSVALQQTKFAFNGQIAAVKASLTGMGEHSRVTRELESASGDFNNAANEVIALATAH